jgi:hypothetical protein
MKTKQTKVTPPSWMIKEQRILRKGVRPRFGIGDIVIADGTNVDNINEHEYNSLYPLPSGFAIVTSVVSDVDENLNDPSSRVDWPIYSLNFGVKLGEDEKYYSEKALTLVF